MPRAWRRGIPTPAPSESACPARSRGCTRSTCAPTRPERSPSGTRTTTLSGRLRTWSCRSRAAPTSRWCRCRRPTACKAKASSTSSGT